MDIFQIASENAREEFPSPAAYGEIAKQAERRQNKKMQRRLLSSFQSLSCEVAEIANPVPAMYFDVFGRIVPG